MNLFPAAMLAFSTPGREEMPVVAPGNPIRDAIRWRRFRLTQSKRIDGTGRLASIPSRLDSAGDSSAEPPRGSSIAATGPRASDNEFPRGGKRPLRHACRSTNVCRRQMGVRKKEAARRAHPRRAARLNKASTKGREALRRLCFYHGRCGQSIALGSRSPKKT